ncbi:MAG: glycosyltransferase [Phycisphaerae bacterium]|nr:glycosyltransferase [Phycisphaerae bacterium]
MPRSVLMLMSQLPHDPASGAPRSDRTVCEFLARAGFRVRCLATTATEQQQPGSALDILARSAVTPDTLTGADALGPRAVHRFTQRGIDYTLLDTARHGVESWMTEHNTQFNALLEQLIRHEMPDITYLYGGLPEERERRKRLRDAGSVIVFTIHNWGYLHPDAFEDIDHVLTPSRFVADRYRDAIGLETTVAPIPLIEADIVPDRRRPTFVTFINPSHDKGVSLVARVAEDICSRRSDIPFMIINARQTAANLVRAGAAGGYDLRRFRQIVYSEGVSSPSHIYAVTRILLVPSVWDEPAGRVTAEAMLCGIPALVADRGGVYETSRGAAYRLPLPDHLQRGSTRPVTSIEARPWVEVIERLFDDPREYADASARATAAGEHYREPTLLRWYADFFTRAARRDTPLRTRLPSAPR